jgi:hypothetical protein
MLMFVRFLDGSFRHGAFFRGSLAHREVAKDGWDKKEYT